MVAAAVCAPDASGVFGASVAVCAPSGLGVGATTSGSRTAKTATTPMTKVAMRGTGEPLRARGTRSSAFSRSTASIENITLAGRPFSPKQPQPPVSASTMPSFNAVVTIA